MVLVTDDTSEGEIEHPCLGCADDVEAAFIWHDGLYRSYVCEGHARKQLPAERTDGEKAAMERKGVRRHREWLRISNRRVE